VHYFVAINEVELGFKPSHKFAHPPFGFVNDCKKRNCEIGMASNGTMSMPVVVKIRKW
jgi:hypothetical protein